MDSNFDCVLNSLGCMISNVYLRSFTIKDIVSPKPNMFWRDLILVKVIRTWK